ncbi:hypothetical protein N7533_000672 [Penicillium manginii]|uniref:uncharacterized protein n=1 Tax=Penicillium manginii TaxID=203109 RepID=UPI0025476F52|nr:uncharacterized protein N7533_000672 [Penicillium manginii]KAJ5768089.1 hypothetical protein N7533_000672 [Penicillium manginii]
MIPVYFLPFLPAALGYVSQSFRPEPQLELRDVEQTTPSLVIDTFQDPIHNDLGFWHGHGENLTIHHEPGSISFFPIDPDQNYHTQFETRGCFSLLPWQDQFLHVVFDGSDQFTVSLNEHNIECSAARAPFPGVPDSVQTSRYVMRTGSDSSDDDEYGDAKDSLGLPLTRPVSQRRSHPSSPDPPGDKGGHGPASPPKTELYIPLSHFLPRKLQTGQLVLRCSVPNSFAFGIDDGQPQFAQEVMRILDEEDVRVTFFVVGAGLQDSTTNFTRFYKEMMKKGHQVALHSNTHPKMEALPTMELIDEEINNTIRVFKERLDLSSRYFRPPFGTVGARMRQQLAKRIEQPFIVNWSVDVEDWLWANTTTPEKQLDAFYRSVARGGNLAVMHFLNPSTVRYLRHFIQHVKALGYNIMRIDQCLADPFSPAL